MGIMSFSRELKKSGKIPVPKEILSSLKDILKGIQLICFYWLNNSNMYSRQIAFTFQ